MGHKLYHEVTDHAPGSWTTGMRLVAAVISLDGNDQTRKSQISQEKLLRKTGLSLAGLKKVLHALAQCGYDFRVSVGTDKRGNPVYTYPHHAMDYAVPSMEKRGDHSSPILQDNGATIPNPIISPETPSETLKTPIMGLLWEPPTTKELILNPGSLEGKTEHSTGTRSPVAPAEGAEGTSAEGSSTIGEATTVALPVLSREQETYPPSAALQGDTQGGECVICGGETYMDMPVCSKPCAQAYDAQRRTRVG